MSGNSIVNLWDRSKPAAILVEKISDAIGVLYEPTRITRKAQAEAKAEQIKSLINVETQALTQKALQRFITEETQKQENIESIIGQALPLISQEAKPENIEKDWLTNFFDKSKLTSDEEIKVLWANILSWEANQPWTFSKRTINFMQSLDKNDALLFTKLCSFNVTFSDIQPLVLDLNSDIYLSNWINFSSLNHLESIWLINFWSLTGYIKKWFWRKWYIFIWDKMLSLEFKKENQNDLKVWKILFTNIWKELASICNPERKEWFLEYIIEEYKKDSNIIDIKIVNTWN